MQFCPLLFMLAVGCSPLTALPSVAGLQNGFSGAAAALGFLKQALYTLH